MQIYRFSFKQKQTYQSIFICKFQKFQAQILGFSNRFTILLQLPAENVENPPNKNIFSQIPNCNLRPYKIALIESLPLNNIATLFVYSEIMLIFAAKSINNWLMTTFALNNLWNYLQGLSLSQSDRG